MQPLPQLGLSPGELHIWFSSYKVDAETLAILREFLSQDEHTRAERFHFPVLRDRFVIGRGAVRMILAHYLGKDPAGLEFAYERYGKPFLSKPRTNLHFNLSHSGDLMVIALCLDQPIGVDIEKEDPHFPVMEIAARFFCESEQRALAQLEGESRWRAFFQIWTAKEAVLKANSLGLSFEPSKVEVALSPLRLTRIEESEGADKSRWHLTALTLEAGYSGALAVTMEPSRMLFRNWLASFPELHQSRPPAANPDPFPAS
jgi:4'-phosphopantetheinyl transferase